MDCRVRSEFHETRIELFIAGFNYANAGFAGIGKVGDHETAHSVERGDVSKIRLKENALYKVCPEARFHEIERTLVFESPLLC